MRQFCLTQCLYDWDWVRLDDRDHLVTTGEAVLCINHLHDSTSGRYQPVQLYSDQTDHLQLEGSYKCINHLDELTHSYCVAAVGNWVSILSSLCEQLAFQPAVHICEDLQKLLCHS